MAHGAVAAQMTVWFQPYQPVAFYSFRQALANLWWALVLIDPLVYGLLIVGGRAFAAHERARQLELRETQLEAELTRATLDALRLEIQPHFLFNTLNAIAAQIRANSNTSAPDDAARAERPDADDARAAGRADWRRSATS